MYFVTAKCIHGKCCILKHGICPSEDWMAIFNQVNAVSTLSIRLPICTELQCEIQICFLLCAVCCFSKALYYSSRNFFSDTGPVWVLQFWLLCITCSSLELLKSFFLWKKKPSSQMRMVCVHCKNITDFIVAVPHLACETCRCMWNI